MKRSPSSVRKALERCGFGGILLDDLATYMTTEFGTAQEDTDELYRIAVKHGEDAANLDEGLGNVIEVMDEKT